MENEGPKKLDWLTAKWKKKKDTVSEEYKGIQMINDSKVSPRVQQ